MTQEPSRASRRFYKTALSEPGEGGNHILLDDKPVRTPRRAALVLPTAPLAEAITEEWRAQGERVDPETMPLTRIANAALDLVRGREEAIVDEIVNYAASDLLCYRASEPQGLVDRQNEAWNPVLDWAAEELEARFNLAEGVMHVAQPGESLAKVRDAFVGQDHFALAALHNMVTLTGSALLALAYARGKITAAEAWQAAHVDEDWQISDWGEDAEAAERRARRWGEFEAAARLFALLGRL